MAWKLVEAERSLERKFEGTPRLVDVRTQRVSEITAREVLAQAGVVIGDSITEETAKRIRQAALRWTSISASSSRKKATADSS